MSSSRNDAFWKMIDEVETSSLLLGREDCTEYQRRREAARRKLEGWLEAEPEGLQLAPGLQSLSGVPVYVGVADLQGGMLSFTGPSQHLVELEVGENVFVGAILTVCADNRLRLLRGAEYSCGVAGDNLYAGQRARMDLDSQCPAWMPVREDE